MTKAPLLQVKELHTHFQTSGGFFAESTWLKAVNGVSFDIHEGEVLSLVGESGCGKSTVGRTLTHLETATSGQAIFNGQDILAMSAKEFRPLRRDIQMIFQDPYSSLNPRMLVKDIIKESLDINSSLNESEKMEKVHWLLDKVGLSAEQSNRYPHEFSGGQRQRIGIARALATEPEIIIADEPVSALDVSIQAQIINLMMDLQQEFDLSIIFIAHDLSVVKHISDRVGVMNIGELVEINHTDDIFKDPKHSYTKELLRAIPEPDPVGREDRKKKRLEI